MRLSNELSKAGSFSCHFNPHRLFLSEILRLFSLVLEPWVAWSIWLPSCSSRFICTQMWDHLLQQPPPRSTSLALSSNCCLAASPLHPGCPFPPLLQVWMNVSSLSPWLSDFHTVRFSVSSGCFLLLNCCCPCFGCARRHSVSTYASILAGSSENS